jgi:excisionase family DNA binding protein
MKLYTTTEAAAYVGLKPTGFLKHAEKIPHEKVGGRRLYTKEALDAFKAIPRKAGRPKQHK